MKTTAIPTERLTAIDVLRGFDMFFLVGAGDVLRRFFEAFHSDSVSGILYHLDHVEWTGFTAWDIIMPLFLFTSGLSMPFSFSKFMRQGGNTKTKLYLKILKRFLLLFLLGWIAQGRLLDLNLNTFHIYCNTLHAIAFGYLITALIILNVHSLKAQLGAGVALLLAYWSCLTFIPVPGFGAGVFTPDGNVAIHIDHAIFGRFDDGTQYTWMLTSLAFGVTVISGYFAGYLLKKTGSPEQKLIWLSLTGVALIAGGLLWGLQMPIIKKIWSPSMVLLSSGLCYLLLALSFLLTDKLRLNGWWVTGLRIFGLNSIAAYMLHTTFHLDRIAGTLLHGFEQYTGVFFPFVVALGEFGLLWFIIRHMYKYGIFIKV
jgi:predicted acyltransferase